MCLNCGCGMPDDNMGDPKNITLTTLAQAAIASQMNGKDTIENTKKALQDQITSEELDKKIEELKKKGDDHHHHDH